MSLALYTKYILEDDKSKFLSLSDEKKFHLLIQLIKRGDVKNHTLFQNALVAVGWEARDFLGQFKELWLAKKIGWEELDIVDTNDHLFKGPGFVSDRWLTTNIGAKEVCDRIPAKHWDDIPYCRAYKERSGL